MEKKYLSVGSWIDKASGKPVSRIAEINSGINKNGQPYEIADTDSRETVDGTYPVGTILAAITSADKYRKAKGGGRSWKRQWDAAAIFA